MPLDQRLDWNGGEIVGAHLGERAAIAADRSAHAIADESFRHCFYPFPILGVVPAKAGTHTPWPSGHCTATAKIELSVVMGPRIRGDDSNRGRAKYMS